MCDEKHDGTNQARRQGTARASYRAPSCRRSPRGADTLVERGTAFHHRPARIPASSNRRAAATASAHATRVGLSDVDLLAISHSLRLSASIRSPRLVFSVAGTQTPGIADQSPQTNPRGEVTRDRQTNSDRACPLPQRRTTRIIQDRIQAKSGFNPGLPASLPPQTSPPVPVPVPGSPCRTPPSPHFHLSRPSPFLTTNTVPPPSLSLDQRPTTSEVWCNLSSPPDFRIATGCANLEPPSIVVLLDSCLAGKDGDLSTGRICDLHNWASLLKETAVGKPPGRGTPSLGESAHPLQGSIFTLTRMSQGLIEFIEGNAEVNKVDLSRYTATHLPAESSQNWATFSPRPAQILQRCRCPPDLLSVAAHLRPLTHYQPRQTKFQVEGRSSSPGAHRAVIRRRGIKPSLALWNRLRLPTVPCSAYRHRLASCSTTYLGAHCSAPTARPAPPRP